MNFSAGIILTSKATAAKFEEFRQNDKFCDVILFSGNALVKAHRVVLAATCPYFEAMFSVGFKETNEEVINLPSIHPDVLPLLVDFMYTGRTTITQSTAQELMVAAHMLCIEDLVIGCARCLKSHLNSKNALSIFRFAETLKNSDLAEHALIYIGKHWTTIAESQEMLKLPIQVLLQILSSNKFVVTNELDVTVSVLRWLDHKPGARTQYWVQLIHLLRLGRLSTDVLENVWKNLKDPHLAKTLHAFAMGMVAQKSTQPRGDSDFYIVGGCTDGFTLATVFKYVAHKKVWEVMASMTTPREYLGVAVHEGRIYAVGGNNTTPLASGEVYDPTINEWSSIAPMNTARRSFGVAFLNGKLYAFGGENDTGILSSIEKYDPVTDEWTPAGNMPYSLCEMSVVTYEGAAYLSGGRNAASSALNTLLRYEVTTTSSADWLTCSNMSRARKKHASAVLGDHLYVIGGCNEKGACNLVARFDFSTGQWEDVAALKEYRLCCMAGVVGGVLLVAGGWYNSLTLSSVTMYEVGKNNWSASPSMPQLCDSASSATL